MASTVGKGLQPAASLPTVPTAEAWRAMTRGQRLDFQLQAIDALAAQRQAKWVRRAAEQAQAQAEQAQAAAQARAVLTVLRVRGIAVPDAERERILAETSTARLERRLEKASVAASLVEVLDDADRG